MYKDYAGKHKIDMYSELINCIKNGKSKKFPELTYGDKVLSIMIAPFSKGAIITSIDITEQKKAEKKLRENEQRYKISIEYAPYGIVVMDSNNKILLVNRQMEKISGYTREEIPDVQTWFKKVYPDEKYRNFVINKFKKIDPKETPRIKEAVITRKDGQKRICQFVSTFTDQKTRIIFINDITEHKKAEEALKESEEKYRELVERANDGIIIIQDKLIKFANSYALQMGGYTMEQIINKPFTDYLHPDDCNRVIEYYKKRLRGEKVPSVYKASIKHKNGEKIPIEINAGIINYKGRPADFVILRNITERVRAEEERKNLQEQLFQAQKMESIGRLAGGIAHDFNNILTGIMGYAELLKLQFPDISTSEGKAADVILRGTERAADLTRQLLGFARGGKYNPIPLNINDVIKEVIEVSEKIFEKNIDIKFELACDIGVIEADKTQIEQVLTNIIINAKDAMPLGGKLTFRTENVIIGEDFLRKHPEFKTGRYVKISITDTGTGMADDVKSHIFEPFFTTKGRDKGTGLGLATVYGIIKNHNGYIDVFSKPGKGTTFTIFLPISDKKILKKSNDKIMKGSGTILLVDDEDSVRNVSTKQLESLGYNVITAKDGSEAINIFRKEKDNVDLILLDMIMPVLSGEKTFLELKKIKPEVKVIFISGYGKDSRAISTVKKGAISFIQKPFKLKNLSEVVYNALKK